MVRIRFTPHPTLDKVAEMYGEVAKNLRDFRPAWRTLKPTFAAGVVQALITQGQSIGAPWAALTARYAARKAREGHGRQPMVRTGLLLGEQRALAAGMVFHRLSCGYYSKIRYSYPIQRGGGKSHLPARRFFGFTPAMEEATMAAIGARADEILAAAAARVKGGST